MKKAKTLLLFASSSVFFMSSAPAFAAEKSNDGDWVQKEHQAAIDSCNVKIKKHNEMVTKATALLKPYTDYMLFKEIYPFYTFTLHEDAELRALIASYKESFELVKTMASAGPEGTIDARQEEQIRRKIGTFSVGEIGKAQDQMKGLIRKILRPLIRKQIEGSILNIMAERQMPLEDGKTKFNFGKTNVIVRGGQVILERCIDIWSYADRDPNDVVKIKPQDQLGVMAVEEDSYIPDITIKPTTDLSACVSLDIANRKTVGWPVLNAFNHPGALRKTYAYYGQSYVEGRPFVDSHDSLSRKSGDPATKKPRLPQYYKKAAIVDDYDLARSYAYIENNCEKYGLLEKALPVLDTYKFDNATEIAIYDYEQNFMPETYDDSFNQSAAKRLALKKRRPPMAQSMWLD